jgi:hypothetical protein
MKLSEPLNKKILENLIFDLKHSNSDSIAVFQPIVEKVLTADLSLIPPKLFQELVNTAERFGLCDATEELLSNAAYAENKGI